MITSRVRRAALLCAVIGAVTVSLTAQSTTRTVRINVLTNTPATEAILADLGTHGTVRDVIVELNAVFLHAPLSELAAIQALPYVDTANLDAERRGTPIDTVGASDFSTGINTWNLDAVNVTNAQPGSDRTIALDGTGVYVAVLDSGLLDTWRQYFPEQRIATEFARAFSGGGQDHGTISEPPNVWEHDQNSHGTHVTSTILGYSLNGTPINGVAPNAKVIPVKVLNQTGSGWSSVIARGIVYVADLKANGAFGSSPAVINMSLAGPRLDAVEKAAIDYAVNTGVIIVAAASNEGEQGMGYPGAYGPVISVAAAGWIGQWKPGADNNVNNWWNADDVAEPTAAKDFYIADFSSRQKAGQDLDVAAPGSWVVGPYQQQSGKTSYFYLSGTSMASPHVAGIVALMMQKNPALSAAAVEATLETTAIPMGAGCVNVAEPGTTVQQCWDTDATGHGLATADRALAALSAASATKRKK
jgi:subtilisin family serine protease